MFSYGLCQLIRAQHDDVTRLNMYLAIDGICARSVNNCHAAKRVARSRRQSDAHRGANVEYPGSLLARSDVAAAAVQGVVGVFWPQLQIADTSRHLYLSMRVIHEMCDASNSSYFQSMFP